MTRWDSMSFFPVLDGVNAYGVVLQELHEFFDQADAFFGPNHEHSLTALTNLTGHPVIALHAGIEKIKTRPRDELQKGSINTNLHSIPRSVQLWSSLFEEGKLITIARDLEERLGVGGSGLCCGRHFKYLGSDSPYCPRRFNMIGH
jgi:hypothetical protein